jgi:hypothetical protein
VKLSWKKVALSSYAVLITLLCLLLLPPKTKSQTTITYAAQELANTFQRLQTFLLGIQLNGSTSGSVTILAQSGSATYTLVLPPNAGTADYLICNSATPGTLTYCAPATFTAAGDLSGSNSSQTVIGLDGIAFSAAPTASGQTYEYDSGTGKWDPTTCP